MHLTGSFRARASAFVSAPASASTSAHSSAPAACFLLSIFYSAVAGLVGLGVVVVVEPLPRSWVSPGLLSPVAGEGQWTAIDKTLAFYQIEPPSRFRIEPPTCFT